MDDFYSAYNLPTPQCDEDTGPEWSGLYNAKGIPLYRERPKPGFDLERFRNKGQQPLTTTKHSSPRPGTVGG